MTRPQILRRAGILLAALALMTAAFALGAAVEGRDAWPWARTAEPPLAPGIHVEVPTGTELGRDGELGSGTAGSGGVGAPGPSDPAATLESLGSAGAGGGAISPGTGGRDTGGTVLRIPNVRVAFGAILARGGDVQSVLVYRAAVEARDAGEYALAAELFDAASAGSGPLVPFAALRAAQMAALDLDGSGEAGAVASRFATLVAPGGAAEALPVSVRAIALMEAATAFEAAGREAEALTALEQVNGLGVGAATRGETLWQRARLTEAMGGAGWEALAVEAMETAPLAVAAREALDLLDARGAEYPAMTGALVSYRGFRNADAEARYEALLDAGGLSAGEASVAWFYLGAVRERAFDREGAIAAYGASLEAAPSGTLAPDALYWRGRVLEELGRPAEAAVEYDRLVAAFPSTRFADDARVRAAVALGLAGEGAEATARLAAITETSAPRTAAQAAHWHAVLVALFDAPPAAVAPAATYDPTSYAAVFEQAGVAATGPIPATALAERPEPVLLDRAPIDQWLTQMTGIPAPATAETAGAADADLELAWLLAQAGEDGVARGLLQTAVQGRRDVPHDLVTLGLEAHRRGLHDVAMTASSVILGRFSPVERLAAPRELLALAYPVPYLPETTAAADEFGVPVLLLYALMRQESAFHPSAGSSAGAFGLTQVIPPTGEAIAQSLGVTDWRFADLARPDVSTRFGAYYLAVQLDAFDGNMLAALAAYNAGPGNAARWLEMQSFPGPDGYLYAVDFTETRSYLELIPGNYAIYRYIYAGVETPSLPHR